MDKLKAQHQYFTQGLTIKIMEFYPKSAYFLILIQGSAEIKLCDIP